ncbi:type II toxin-antitoxin system VapC family toxin [Methylocystis parvus]|uniref:Ribonuclease VapC n=1 Tax=Methylocystis parvus TaxID=134 RepID=A0A6B8MD89_9HYPH|nr:type II toxin-antitoxin system VapC family toxin [Methylocystis parvus]QGM99273.1 type II toxin-antitoxin system VapC family toxin [Methylocystis parvus]WBK00340.1 type II toxin-antitoxin system VapC family toxin [Methylocystis parvus OBBP]
MILLDTNVISEMMKPDGDAKARRWLDSYAETDFYIATPVIAELRYGLALLAEGRKKAALTKACDIIEDDIFAGRILAFDQRAAHAFASLRAKRQTAGRPLAVMDGMIASIATAHAMTIASRNVDDFAGLDLPIVNPFEAN